MEITLANRDDRLDLIRVIAGFCVVFIHVAGHGMAALTPLSAAWDLRNVLNCFLRPAAPIFFILSGILFLHPDRDLHSRHFLRNHIFRIVRLWLVWSALYALADVLHLILNTDSFPAFSQIAVTFLQSFLAGHYHMWFLPAILVAYLCAPVLQMLFSAQERKLPSVMGFLFLLFLGITLLIKTLEPFPSFTAFRGLSLLSAFPLIPTGLLYFVTGQLLTRQRRHSLWCYFFIYIGSCTAMVLVNRLYVSFIGQNAAVTYGYETLWVFIASISCFLFLMELFTSCPLPEHLKPALRYISGCTVGIYLIHAFLIEELGAAPLAHLFRWTESPLGLLLYTVLIYGLSLVLTTVIHQALYFLRRWCYCRHIINMRSSDL